MTTQNLSSVTRSGPIGSPTLRRMLLLALAAGVLFAASAWLVAPAVAYIGQNPYTVRLEGPSRSVACSDHVTISGSVKDAKTGKNVGQQSVLWSLTTNQSSQDQVSPAHTVTANDGTTSVTLTFGAVSGKRVVQAMIASYPAKISVTCNTGVVQTPAPGATPTPRTTAKAPTPAPGTTPEPGTTPAPGTTPGSGATPTPIAAASGPVSFETPSPALTSPTASGAVSASPAASQNPGTSHDPDAGGGGIASAVILVGGLAILGAAAGLLWFALRRRPGAGRPPMAR